MRRCQVRPLAPKTKTEVAPYTRPVLNLQRKRLIGALFVGNAISSVSYIGAITVATLVAKALTGRDELSGIPAMLATFGTAAGAVAMTALSRKAGRRPAFILGYLVAAVGAWVGLSAVVAGSFVLFLIGMAILGFGRSVAQLSRYAAGDLAIAKHRGAAISLVVWAATIGSVVGPLLIAPSGRVLLRIAGNELAGPFAVGGIGFICAALFMIVFLRPEPLSLVVVDGGDGGDGGDGVDHLDDDDDGDDTLATPVLPLVRRSGVLLALGTLAISQLVMVTVMVMTPVHIRENGQELGMVGWVMMAHTLGMFAIAPLTGMLVDRIGARRVIALAMVVLGGAALLSATAARAEPAILVVSLFLLGAGWNFGFVAGSTALTEHVAMADRLRLQGMADSLTWISGGLGALASGIIVSATSYPLLGVISATLTLLPLALLVRERRLDKVS